MSHVAGTTGSVNHTFTIPAGSGTYDATPLYIRRSRVMSESTFSDVLEIVVAVHSLPTSATVELEYLKPGLDPLVDANWAVASSLTAVAHNSPITLFASGVRIRGKSAGTGGACNVSAFWYY